MNRGLLALVLATGCRATVSPPAPRPVRVHAPRVVSARGPARPEWTLLAPRDLPSPLGDIAALPDHAAVVIASGRLFRWREGHASPVCDAFQPAPRALVSDGARFVAIGEDSDGNTFLWQSPDAGEHCTRTQVTGLFVGDVARLEASQVALRGTTVLVSNSNGALVQSDDAGTSWRRLPDLPGVTVAWPRARGGAIASARVASRSAEADSSRVRLFVLEAGAASVWHAVGEGRDRRLPLVLRERADGSVFVADAIGTASVTVDGHLVADAPLPFFHRPPSAPSILVAAGSEQVIALATHTLSVLDAHGARPFSPVPASGARALDADPDGNVWLTTPSRLYASHVGEPLHVVTSSPLGDARAMLLAASGAHLAVVTTEGVVVRSDDDGAHWQQGSLPEVTSNATAVAVSPRGRVLVLGAQALVASDGTGFTRIAVPLEGEAATEPTVHIAGDRWIVVQNAVLTSDDQGAHWQHRSLDPGAPVEPVVVGGSFRGGAGVLLDTAGRIYRTDDAASTFQSIAAPEGLAVQGRASSARIAWDGARGLAVFTRDFVSRSSDGGATWMRPSESRRMFDTLVSPTFTRDGRLAGMSRTGGCTESVSDRFGQSPATLWFLGESQLAPDACEHAAAAWAFDSDDDSVVIATASGAIWRGSLATLGARRP